MLEEQAQQRQPVRAVVGVIKGIDCHRHAVAYLEKGQVTQPSIGTDGDITFSLAPETWTGEVEPQKGQVVLLYNVAMFARGWRALRASPVTLELKSKEGRDADEK